MASPLWNFSSIGGTIRWARDKISFVRTDMLGSRVSVGGIAEKGVVARSKEDEIKEECQSLGETLWRDWRSWPFLLFLLSSSFFRYEPGFFRRRAQWIAGVESLDVEGLSCEVKFMQSQVG